MGIQYKVDLAGLGPIATKLAQEINRTLDKAEAIRKDFISEMSDRIVDSTPVDTGRCKANNQIAVNAIPQRSLYEFDKEGTSTKKRNRADIAKSMPDDTVYLYNQVTYSENLEHGTSTQAPHGFYGVNIADAKSVLAEVIAKHKA